MDILFQNSALSLTVGSDCVVRSLIIHDTKEECVDSTAHMPLFAVTQERPFNNEVKLSHPCTRMTYAANRLERNGNLLTVRFEVVPVCAQIEVTEKENYIAFTLKDFLVKEEDYGDLRMDKPPVAEFRLLQLPLKNRARYGEWLNVLSDDKNAICVMANAPHPEVGSSAQYDRRVLWANAQKGIKLKGATAVLIASARDAFLDCVAQVENDYALPKGVESRKNPLLNASVYWTHDVTPENVEEHIARAKQGGFRLMLMYYTCFVKEKGAWGLNGNYDFNEAYPNGTKDVKRVLDAIRESGILPGLHFLHTHIGLQSRYVTPVCDHRLNLTQRYTLARPLSETDTELFVEECPAFAPMDEKCRVLRFGGELIAYQGFTEEPPYKFTGLTRGAHNTTVNACPAGLTGGILDISEFCGNSCYVNQNSSLQDEIAEKIANIYNCGFGFCYMDGSEGTNAPFSYHVANAQYRVYKHFSPAPLFTEGAARSHFSWHFQSGGNAFDIFPPAIFKEKIAEHPATEAPRMQNDFTRIDFGWWGFWAPSDKDDGIQADMYEYGTSRAAAWDCPATIQADLSKFKAHPRCDDIFAVMKAWENARAKGLVTAAWKDKLRNLSQEYTLLENETLAKIRRIASPEHVTAFLIEEEGPTRVMLWHNRGEATLRLGNGMEIAVKEKKILTLSMTKDEAEQAFAKAVIL